MGELLGGRAAVGLLRGVGVLVIDGGLVGYFEGVGFLLHWDWACVSGGLNWRVRMLLERE
jgi:hypothetical protein